MHVESGLNGKKSLSPLFLSFLMFGLGAIKAQLKGWIFTVKVGMFPELLGCRQGSKGGRQEGHRASDELYSLWCFPLESQTLLTPVLLQEISPACWRWSNLTPVCLLFSTLYPTSTSLKKLLRESGCGHKKIFVVSNQFWYEHFMMNILTHPWKVSYDKNITKETCHL